MAYLIVQYWTYLAIAAGIGVAVGWWAQGSRRAGPQAWDEGER